MGWNYRQEDEKDFGPRLEPGARQAVVFAVYDMGNQETTYNGKTKVQHKIRLGIELNETYTEGQFKGQRITRYPKFTLSFYGEAKLAKVVQGILGRDMTEDEIRNGGEVLIGKNFSLTVLYPKNDDGTESKFPDYIYSQLMKGTELIEPVLKSDYLPEFITKERNEKSVKKENESIPNNIKNEMHWQIQDWINANKISAEDVKSTIRLIAKDSRKWGELTEQEAKDIYSKIENHVNLLTEGKDDPLEF